MDYAFLLWPLEGSTDKSLQAAKALRWQPCTELQASDKSKRDANPGRGSRNYIAATSHGLSRFLGASCGWFSAKGRLPSTWFRGSSGLFLQCFWATSWFRGGGSRARAPRAPFHVMLSSWTGARTARACGANRLARSCREQACPIFPRHLGGGCIRRSKSQRHTPPSPPSYRIFEIGPVFAGNSACKHGTLQAEPLPILAPSRLDNQTRTQPQRGFWEKAQS